MPQLHHRGEMPPPPRDADGARRDRADPRRSDPRRRHSRGRAGRGRRVSRGGVAVVGGGASGSLQALHLLRAGIANVTLIEREREPGRGVAYSTRRPEHLLNVPARRMSAFPDDPDHFTRWFAARGGGADQFAPRLLYGDYLTELL